MGRGVSIGTILAVIISWSLNRSLLWAVVHGIFGWFYVLYAVVTFNVR